MSTKSELNIVTPLSEPERHFLHRLQERTREVAEAIAEEAVGNTQPEDTMADLEERNMTYYAKPSLGGYESSVAQPAIAANNFEIKSSIIHLVETSSQFNGRPDEDPNAHIARFLRICATFKIHNCSDDADDDESLHAAWERYKSLLRRCPHHGLDLWLQCQTFYDAISGAHKQAIDQCAAGDFGRATPTEAF
ncbi:hypothetical protein L1987_48223 [Smallanthus sonchifolius]|uniref:Uncharacterized protein n=1 Tax=Smallanthus sonchifolius TaxID=185202 RepID=A0ACB9FQQ8_9ASTR|nr:hypothetical protein L1987_48223 [Smallanthus sonchifolius]